MLHIVLLVLKIIGIILATVTVLCALILLIPFSYVGKGEFKEEAKATFVSRGFLSLIYFKFTLLDSDVRYVLRILGLPVMRGTIGQNEESDEDDIQKLTSDFEADEGIKKSKKAKNKILESDIPNKYAGMVTLEETEDIPDSDKSEDDNSSNGKVEFSFSKLRDIPEYIKNLKGKYTKLKKFLKSKKTKIAYYYAKDILKKIYYHIKPGKLEANLIFGFDSPDKTGKALAVLGMVYGTVKIDQDKFRICPDFENKRLEGTLYMKGHFVLGYVLVQLFKLYFKKEVHDIIERFNK